MLKKRTLIITGIAFLVLLVFFVSPFPYRLLHSWLLTGDILKVTLYSRPSLKESPSIEMSTVIIPVSRDVIRADLYCGNRKKFKGSVLLVHGAVPEGRANARMKFLANSLARSGFRVLVPDLAGLKSFRLQTEDVQSISSSVRYLKEQAKERVGVISMGLGSGPAFIACTQKEIREDVKFLVLIGCYCNLKTVLSHLMTGVDGVSGETLFSLPLRHAKWVFFSLNIGLVPLPEDQLLLQDIIQKRLYSGTSDVEDLINDLSADGMVVYTLLENRDPDRTGELLNMLPSSFLSLFRVLSPCNYAQDSPDRVFIIHSLKDSLIPLEESQKLARLIQESNGGDGREAEFFTVSENPPFSKKRELFKMVYKILSEATKKR